MYVIAYDVGTTGIKSGLFRIEKDHSIDPVAGQVADFDLYILDNGGVEQNPLQWWEAMCKTTPVLLTEAGIGAEEISGISFCAQMQAVVLVDREGNPVRNAMSYMDNRGVEQMRKGIQTGPKVAGMNVFKLLHSLRISGAVSGSVKDPVWKYRWVADNEPELFAKVYKWLDVKDFLVLKATGEFTMSHDSAFSTLLYDTRIAKRYFSEKICRMMDVNMDHLPEIVLSTDVVGGITDKAAEELGLVAGTPVFSGSGDASLIGVGSGAVYPGDTHVYMGTSGWVSTVTEKQKLDVGSMIASIAGAELETFNCFAELETAGKCLEWARNHLMLDNEDAAQHVINTYEYLAQKVSDIPPGSRGILFTPWLHGNRNPFEDPNARGLFFGIGMETTTAEMYHAVIEGVCLHLKWQMEAMSKLIEPSEAVRFAGGGAIQDLHCQILADVLGKRIEVTHEPQNAGSVGAAAIMAVGLEQIENIQDVKKMIPVERIFEPNPENTEIYNDAFRIFKDLYKKNVDNFRRAADLR